MKNILPLLIMLVCWTTTDAQEIVYRTFKDTRVINSHSVETLQKRKLDVRISHRFGDIGGNNGGWETFYGLENATDILIGADYGVTDNLMVGFYRTKGAGPLRQLLNGTLKYRLIRQGKETGAPITLTLVNTTSFSTAKKTNAPDVLTNFTKTAHRFSYNFQVLLARQFSERFSLQLAPSYTHRNLVTATDENGLFSLGIATRIQVTKVIGIIADATFPFSDLRNSDNGYYPPIGIGLEFDTGGHIFQLNFTNATGLMDTDYIPNTRSSWGDGEFRLGFTISRMFNL